MSGLLQKYGGTVLLFILAFAYLTRMYQLNIPERYMFDEVYHAVTSKLIAQNDPRAFEWWNPPPEPDTAVDWLHPPIAKYTQAFFILIFGDNSFGWRYSSVLFGVLTILMVFHLTNKIFDDPRIGYTTAALASLDGLLLTQSRITMNDIHVTFFILLALYFYYCYKIEKKYRLLFLTGISCGLAAASKWSGVYVLGTIIAFESLEYIKNIFSLFKKKKKNINFKWFKLRPFLLWFSMVIILPVAMYFLSYTQMFLQGKGWAHFKELHQQIWHYQTTLEATHPYQSRPWQWMLNIRPVWYYVDFQENSRADIFAQGNYVVFIGGLVAVMKSVLTISQKLLKRKTLAQIIVELSQSKLFFIVIAYMAVWVPWFFSPRIMFFYHYTPAVPLLCIILAYWLIQVYEKKKLGKIFFWTILAAAFLNFVIWYPHWVGIPLPMEIKDTIYLRFKIWQ